ERWAEPLDTLEVLEVRVPAAERDLDKRHSALDQPPSQQTALAKAIAAIAVPQFGRLLVELEGAGGAGRHQANGALIGRLMAARPRIRMTSDEATLQTEQQLQPRLGLPGSDVRRSAQILDFESRSARANQQRRILRAKKTRAIGVRACAARRSDA